MRKIVTFAIGMISLSAITVGLATGTWWNVFIGGLFAAVWYANAATEEST